MKILLFGGTTEGRVLAEKLSSLGAEVTVSVATRVGEEELAGLTEVQVVTGRLDQPGMEALLSGFDLCVDATHPYAVRATANIRAACEAAGVPLRRLLRGPSQAEGVIRVDSCARAAEFLAGTQGNILLATGSKELSVFGELERERLFARVLPTYEGIAACEGLGKLPVTVGENLGFEGETVSSMTAFQCAERTFAPLNVLLAEPAPRYPRRAPGIPDGEFLRAEGVPMTKQTVRTAILAKLAAEALEGAEITQISVSQTRAAGQLHLLLAQNPVFLITGAV